jgi:acyl-coenzyme A synthetase/AMP-(fatty) acid ligase
MQALPNTSIYIMYGQTEAAPRLTYLEPREIIRKAGSIGKAIPGVAIELITEKGVPAAVGEEGEIVASGGNIMIGYWNNPEATRKVLKDGKLYTGDIAKMDEEGFLYIVGRQNDMIKSGAHRVSAKEIEEIILELKAVHETAVIGVDDKILGEAIKAFVVLKEGATLDAKEVQRHCALRLASFKIPKEVSFVADLPKTNSGKVRRHMLKNHENNVIAQSSGKDEFLPK